MAGTAGPDKTWCGFLLISFHHSRGFAASGNQSLSFVGRFMTARCIFVVLARLAVCPPDLRFVSTQPNASLAGNLSGPIRATCPIHRSDRFAKYQSSGCSPRRFSRTSVFIRYRRVCHFVTPAIRRTFMLWNVRNFDRSRFVSRHVSAP